jgi:hypothetical protein
MRKHSALRADDLPVSLLPARPGTARTLRAVVAVVAVVAAMLPAAAATSAQAVVPAPRSFGPGLEAPAGYEGQTLCSPTVKPGAAKLAALLVATYGKATIGIPRSCSIGGTSEHKEGRALDWMVSYKVPTQRPKAQQFLAWLLAPDADGNPAAMARRLGVMYIGWNNRFWSSYDLASGWTDLKGCTTDPAKKASGYDTYCHRNHVHLSLSWDGAAGLTSYWTGSPVADACQAPWGSADATAGTATDLVPVAPVRVLDTRAGTGLDAPCRLSGGSSWDPTRHDAVVHVTGVGDVPADGVAAVAVRVTVSRPSAPVPTVSVRSTASSPSIPLVTSVSSLSTGSTTVVPVASDGTIRIGVDRGGVDVVAEVVGWAPLPITPPPPAAADVAGGLTHATRTTLVYDTAAHPLAPGETRTVHLAGVGPVPASGLTGLALTMTAGTTKASDLVGVLAPSGRSFLGTVRTSSVVARTTQVLLPTTTGDVVLRNLGTAPAPVTLALNGWFAPTASPDGGQLALLDAPVTLVDSSRNLGLTGPVTRPTARIVTLTGSTVPVGAKAVLLAVDARGGATDDTLTMSSLTAVPTVSFVHRQWSHETVLVALRSDGRLAVRTGSLGAHVRLTVLGYVA